MKQFNEEDHPRDSEGKFMSKDECKTYRQNTPYEQILSDKEDKTVKGYQEFSAEQLKQKILSEQEPEGNETENYSDELSTLLGEEFKGVKGQAAVDKLMQEKHGHVKGAFHREDMGAIDLIWGSDTVGLKHIIKQREKQSINAQEFVRTLAETVEKGKFYKKNNRGDFEFVHNGKLAIIAVEYHGSQLTYLLTAYKTRIKKHRQKTMLDWVNVGSPHPFHSFAA